MRYLIFILCCSIAHFGNAQADASSEAVVGMGFGNSVIASSSMMTAAVRSLGPRAVNPRFDNIKGSAYLADYFLPTKLYYDGEFMENIFYRFNAYNQEIEVKLDAAVNLQDVEALGKDKKISILVDNRKMGFKTFVTADDKTLNGYLITLLDGDKYVLYKREHTVFYPGTVPTSSFVQATPNKFVKHTEYYVQKEGNNRIDEIEPNTKKFLKVLDGQAKNSIKLFIKDNKLNTKDEADLMKIFEELNK